MGTGTLRAVMTYSIRYVWFGTKHRILEISYWVWLCAKTGLKHKNWAFLIPKNIKTCSFIAQTIQKHRSRRIRLISWWIMRTFRQGLPFLPSFTSSLKEEASVTLTPKKKSLVVLLKSAMQLPSPAKQLFSVTILFLGSFCMLFSVYIRLRVLVVCR